MAGRLCGGAPDQVSDRASAYFSGLRMEADMEIDMEAAKFVLS
jgi:hypothetical protein